VPQQHVVILNRQKVRAKAAEAEQIVFKLLEQVCPQFNQHTNEQNCRNILQVKQRQLL